MSKLFYLMAIITPFILVSCGSNSSDENQIEAFSVANPTLNDTSFNKEFVADIQAIKNIEIRSRISGFIDKIHIDEGAFVTEGQLMFSISAQEFMDELQRTKAQLKSAQAELKSIQVELKNTKNLFAKNIVSKSEVEILESKIDAAEAKCDELKAAVATAQLNVSFTQLKAPFSGFVNRIPTKIGSLIEAGTVLTTLSDNNEVFAYFKVSELEYLNFVKNDILKNQEGIELILADNSKHNELGKIETMDGEIEKSTGNISFRARFKNPKKILKHGSSGKINIQFDLKNAVLIPMSSTFEVQENFYVYIVNSDNKLKMKRIYPRVSLGSFYVIEKGLSKNDRVLLEGIQLVKEGQEIKVKN
jgi:membrane fusion protein (multidrug efflux system)